MSDAVKHKQFIHGKTRGQSQFVNGIWEFRIYIQNVDAPELPRLDLPEELGWTYIGTDYSWIHETTTYVFNLEDNDHNTMDSITFLYDMLYG